MRFSIIIPVYNVDKYLDKCLKSLKDQIYQNFEVIIVNDGTKDNSQTIIDQYVLEDEPENKWDEFKEVNNK
ncbi:MAG: glycosyltransferase family 2 protein, partial [Firmicutes bacterium]|nr:glycosyltransferase family 2 protein [Bacillota bacterium]